MAASSFSFQVRLLLRKNAHMLARNAGSTALQVGVGVLFLLLLFLINAGLNSNTRSSSLFSDTKDLPAERIGTLRQCNPKDAVGSPVSLPGDTVGCFTFAYAPHVQGSKLHRVISSVASKAGIPPVGAKGGPIGFASERDMLEFLLEPENQGRVAAALTFAQNDTSLSRRTATKGQPGSVGIVSYSLRYNDTSTCTDFGTKCTNNLRDVVLPLQSLVDGSLAGHLMNRSGSKAELGPEDDGGAYSQAPHELTMDQARSMVVPINVSVKPFPHPDLDFKRDAMQQYGDMFMFAAFMFNFILQLSYIVTEKQLRLREAMKQMGLRASAYWVSWFATNSGVNLVQCILLCATGALLQLNFFVKNSFFLYFTFFYVTATSLTCASFFLSALLSRAEQARNLGFFLFIIFFIASKGLVAGYYSSDAHPEAQTLLSLVLPIPFFQAIDVMITHSSGSDQYGLSWTDGGITPPYYPVHGAIGWLILNGIIYVVLAWYCDEVVPSEFGVKRGMCFCASRSYWFGSTDDEDRDPAQLRREALSAANYVPPEDADVRDEAEQVRSGRYNAGRAQGGGMALELLSLRKSFGDFQAVQGLDLGVDRGQLLCMLGHNGAGKTTTINVLTGMLPITSGDATVYDKFISRDMDQIRAIMGICPQHDILWDQLTGMEHLRLFAGLRGVPEEGNAIEEEAAKRLKQVELWGVRDVQSRAYSGGMKRRLSMAIALIGDPKIVFLDEPTTGMDPVTRRSVWDMIEAAKRDRVILLTTHSMEEADVLGDRICIMSRGKIQALGSSIHLKKKFGTGYRLTVFFKKQSRGEDSSGSSSDAVDKNEDKCTKLIHHHIPRADFRVVAPGLVEYDVPRSARSVMPALFKDLMANRDAMGIADTSISLATLEEVFLNLSRAELEQDLELDKVALANFNESNSFGSKRMCTVEFLVPEGASPGATLAIPHPEGGSPVHITVPEGAEAGATLRMEVESRQQENTQTSESTAKASSSNTVDPTSYPQTVNHSSFWSQFKALAIKTLIYQKRQRVQTCCLCGFPILCIAILLLAQALLDNLNPVHEYDFDCINSKFREAYLDTPYGNSLACSSVGCVSVGAKSFLNPEGGDNSEVAWFDVPYATEGDCAREEISSTCSIGSLSREVPTNVTSWYHDMLSHLYEMGTCNKEYTRYLSQHADVSNAADWEKEYDPQNSQAGYNPVKKGTGFSLNDCKKSVKKKKTASVQGFLGSDGASWKPTKTVLDQLHEQQHLLKKCQDKFIDGALERYRNIPLSSTNIEDTGAAADQWVTAKRGVVGRYTTQSFGSPIFATYEQFVSLTMLDIITHNSSCLGTTRQFESKEDLIEEELSWATSLESSRSTGVDPTHSPLEQLLALNHPCEAFAAEGVLGPITRLAWNNFKNRVLNHSTACSRALKIPNSRLKALMDTIPAFCWVENSRDTLRSLTFTRAAPSKDESEVDAVDNILYESWKKPVYGSPGVKYSRPGAYTFEKMRNPDVNDDENPAFAYTAWYNATGSKSGGGFFLQGLGQSNWIGLVGLMNRAIFAEVTNADYTLESTRAPWPKIYTESNLLGAFGTFSIIDLVGGFFFPFVLFMLMPIIMSVVMYEKEFRLREVSVVVRNVYSKQHVQFFAYVIMVDNGLFSRTKASHLYFCCYHICTLCPPPSPQIMISHNRL